MQRRQFISTTIAAAAATALPGSAAVGTSLAPRVAVASLYGTLRRLQEFAAASLMRGSYRQAIYRLTVDGAPWSVATDGRYLFAARGDRYADREAAIGPGEVKKWPDCVTEIVRSIAAAPSLGVLDLASLREFCGEPTIEFPCVRCQGTGRWDQAGVECESCDGDGVIIDWRRPIEIAGIPVYANLLAWLVRDLPDELVSVRGRSFFFPDPRSHYVDPRHEVPTLALVAEHWLLVQCGIDLEIAAPADDALRVFPGVVKS